MTSQLPGLGLSVAFVVTLVWITLTDLDRRVIPNRVLFLAAVVAIVTSALAEPGAMPERALAAVAGGAVLLLVALIHPTGMGMGDVKLVAVMGLYLGAAIVPALVVAFAIGAGAGAALLVRHGLRARKRAIPFGPYLAAGGLTAMLFGDQMLAWYLAGL